MLITGLILMIPALKTRMRIIMIIPMSDAYAGIMDLTSGSQSITFNYTGNIKRNYNNDDNGTAAERLSNMVNDDLKNIECEYVADNENKIRMISFIGWRFKAMAYPRTRIISLERHIDMICIHTQIMLTLISRKVIDMPFDDKNIHMIPDEDLHDGYDSADDKDDND